MDYFSDREAGESPRDSEEISDGAWKGILAKIRTRVIDGSFGATYPQMCPDGDFVYGTNASLFVDTIQGDIPNLSIDVELDSYGIRGTDLVVRKKPPTLVILDLIEFCWRSVGKPLSVGGHSYFGHNHFAFDEEAGREEFREEIETIFRRNSIAYVLTEEGRIERLAPPVLQNTLVQSVADTGDKELDRLLATAQQKFLNPNPAVRREALEALWDAWERLKTLDGQGDKKARIEAMLDRTAGEYSPRFRSALEQEATELTNIGNSLRIRHSETSQETIAGDEHGDYLFYRLFSLVRLILQARKPTEE